MSLLAAVGTVRGAAVPDLVPGREVRVPWDGLKNDLIVRLPDDWTADRTWPVVFHFHGSGGAPTVDIPLRYTEGKAFVLVGMEYATRDMPAATADYLEREWALLAAVRDALVPVAKISPQRVYVGGFSQGGWFASEFLEVRGAELAGGYVLGAGKRPRNKREPKRLSAGQPVFLGIGQIDPNHIYSVQGIRHFGGLGGTVTYDEWLGQDHRMPMGGGGQPLSAAFRQWFRTEEFRGREAGLLSEATAWAAREKEATSAEKDPLRQWLRLTRAKGAPFFRALQPAQRQAFDAAAAQMERHPALREELALRRQYLDLVDREMRGPATGNLWPFTVEQARKYHALWQSAPTTHHGKRAAVDFSRLRSQLAQPQMWRFPTEGDRDRSVAQLEADPLPAPPEPGLLAEFRELWAALEHA